MMTHTAIGDASLLTQLIAAHGVYALTVLVTFYIQWRAKKNLDKAARVDHEYFKQCHAMSVIATYLLIVASSAVWIYATFFYVAKAHVHGSVINLTAQGVEPRKAGDRPFLRQQITTAANDVELYQNKRNDEVNIGDGRYALDWVVLPHENEGLNAIVLNFQHQYKVWNSSSQAVQIQLSDDPLETKTITQSFTLNLAALSYPRSIQLLYEPPRGDAVRTVGTLQMLKAGKRFPIPWDSQPMVASTSHTRHPLFEQPFVIAFAAVRPVQNPSSPFDENGNYDAAVGRVLRERLGSPDLKTQLVAYAFLVESRNRALKFIADSLRVTNETNYDRQLLVHNLSRATEEIARTQAVPPDLMFDIALQYVRLNDYESAARFFNHSSTIPIRNPNLYFTRGYVYSQTHDWDRAVADLEKYLNAKTDGARTAQARAQLGWCFEHLANPDGAIEQYRAALAVDPDSAMAANNLAYVYAERGERLDEALSLVNHALEIRAMPTFQDTKGWILYRLGRYREAVDVLKQSVAASPGNDVHKNHLDAALKALSSGANTKG
jgi:predicted negative regulator of RcsB-dependent stress response